MQVFEAEIDLFEGAITGSIGCRMSRIRGDEIALLHEAIDARPVTGETGADRRRPGSSQARAGMALQALHWLFPHICDGLHPEPGVSTAIGSEIAQRLESHIL